VPRPRIRPIAHDDRLPLVDHLDELRTRIIISLLVLAVAVGLCFWQNHLILQIMNAPLDAAHSALPEGFKPITLGVAEQFSTTFAVSAYFAILISLPVLLYQAYAFVMPAFTPSERRVALPLLLMVPVLFVGGVVFCYFVVLEPALQFLLNFNADEFTTQLRARDYYGFVSMTMIAMGLLFQVPVGVLALTRMGITTPEKLRRNRPYAILAMAVIAALLPTIDPVTLLIEMIPLVALYELSILLARAFGRPAEDLTEATSAETG
jgi:sec-independent protein translocase protein TatC